LAIIIQFVGQSFVAIEKSRMLEFSDFSVI